MSNVVGFLECVGQDARLRHASKDELDLALTGMQIAPEVQSAILGRDQVLLNTLLNAKSIICCGMAPGKEDDDEGEESPSKEDEIAAQSALRCVA